MPSSSVTANLPFYVNLLECKDVPPAEQKRNSAEDSETAIDTSPRDRNATNMSCDERQWNHSSTSDEPEGDHPLVTDRIAIPAEERNGDDEMSKREPSAVGWIRRWVAMR